MCCFQLVEQCEDEELMDIVLPRLTKMLSLWELLLAKVETLGWVGCTKTPESWSAESTVFFFPHSSLYFSRN